VQETKGYTEAHETAVYGGVAGGETLIAGRAVCTVSVLGGRTRDATHTVRVQRTPAVRDEFWQQERQSAIVAESRKTGRRRCARSGRDEGADTVTWTHPWFLLLLRLA
jgi:hypothetical protein